MTKKSNGNKRSALMGWVFVFWMVFISIIQFTGILLSFFIIIVPLMILVFLGMNLYWIIKRNELLKKYLKNKPEAQNQFFILLIVCSSKVLAADGKIDKAEIQMVKNFFTLNFGFGSKELLWVEETLQNELKYNRPVASLAVEINKFMDYPSKLALMDFLFRVAASDSTINEQEKVVLNEFSVAIGISAVDQSFLKARYGSSRAGGYSSASSGKGRDHYLRILGLAEGVKQADIKSAYRQLAKKFHPDVVAHLGDEVRLASEKRMKEILEAYEFLKDT
jgi:DnaJ like chaperone protein